MNYANGHRSVGVPCIAYFAFQESDDAGFGSIQSVEEFDSLMCHGVGV